MELSGSLTVAGPESPQPTIPVTTSNHTHFFIFILVPSIHFTEHAGFTSRSVHIFFAFRKMPSLMTIHVRSSSFKHGGAYSNDLRGRVLFLLILEGVLLLTPALDLMFERIDHRLDHALIHRWKLL